MNIHELEEKTGISKQNIRFYEKKGLLHPARNEVNRYREYTQEDLQTHKKVAQEELRKQFSFKPDTMVGNAREFTDALFTYARENGLNLVITKEGMCPTFEIDGVEYTAMRIFGRFGATIRCRMTHPGEAEAAEVPKARRRLLLILQRGILPLLFLLYISLVLKNAGVAILISAVLFFCLWWRAEGK